MPKNTPKINMSQEHFAGLLKRIEEIQNGIKELQAYIAKGQKMTPSQRTVVEKALCKCLDLLNPTQEIKF